MASKFIIFLVLTAVAQSSAAVEYSELEGKLSTIKEAGNATLTNFYAVVNGFFKGIDDKLKTGGCNEKVILEDIIDAFQTAFDNTVAGMRPVAKNTTVFEELEAGSKDSIRTLVLTTWSLFNVTPASKNLTATLEEFEAIKAEVTYQVGQVWNVIFDMALDSINSEEPKINWAIRELQPKATSFALKAAEVVAAAIKIYVTKFAPGLPNPEESSDYLEALQILNNLGLASMSAEVNEKFDLLKYIATYYCVFDIKNVKNFTRLMNDEITVAGGLWEVFGEVLWFIDDENDSHVSYDTLAKLIYGGLEAAYYSTWDAIISIQITGEFQVQPDDRIPKLAEYIIEAVKLAGQEITPEVSSQIDGKNRKVVALAVDIWGSLYENLELLAKDIEGAQPAITSSSIAASAGVESAFNYLFLALKNELSADFPAEEGILYSVGSEVSTKFGIIRICRLIAYLLDRGIKIPFSSVYNNQF